MSRSGASGDGVPERAQGRARDKSRKAAIGRRSFITTRIEEPGLRERNGEVAI
jgi:hypothetical protein